MVNERICRCIEFKGWLFQSINGLRNSAVLVPLEPSIVFLAIITATMTIWLFAVRNYSQPDENPTIEVFNVTSHESIFDSQFITCL